MKKKKKKPSPKKLYKGTMQITKSKEIVVWVTKKEIPKFENYGFTFEANPRNMYEIFSSIF